MENKDNAGENAPINPTRREKLRPLELLLFSGGLAVFGGLIVLLSTRQVVLSAIFAGAGFIIVVVLVALLGLGGKPSAEDEEAASDLQRPDDVWH